MVLAIAASFVIPALAMAEIYCGEEEILGEAMFEGMSEMKFPAGQDTNIDMLSVGNDKALAFGSIWGRGIDPKAEITWRSRRTRILAHAIAAAIPMPQSDNTSPCAVCQDACTKVNIESIKVGNRDSYGLWLWNMPPTTSRS